MGKLINKRDGVDLEKMPKNWREAVANKKACKGCAFRIGSQERIDPYGWVRRVEAWLSGESPHYCHESAPNHSQEVKDGNPRWRLCACTTACLAGKADINKVALAPLRVEMKRGMIERENEICG
jgi:hypothetical protein